MAESKTLLSQKEIDALVNFLRTNASAPIGRVLDQASIDKLIDLVTYNNKQGIFVNSAAQESVIPENTVLLDLTSSSEEQRKNCTLHYGIGKNGYVEISCIDKVKDIAYIITPACLEHRKYIDNDETSWGYAIEPRVFNDLALLLGVSYTAETFNAVISGFARLMFGDADAQLPSIYLPSED